MTETEETIFAKLSALEMLMLGLYRMQYGQLSHPRAEAIKTGEETRAALIARLESGKGGQAAALLVENELNRFFDKLAQALPEHK